VALQDRPDLNVAIEDTEAKVIGIFESGFVFGDNQLFMPLEVTQRIFKQGAKASHAFVTASSVDKVEEVQEALWKKFQGKADVISGLNIAASWAKALKAIRLNSLLAAGVSAGAGALVVLFTMMLITRERTREIGILKAIEASNGDVAGLFIVETIALATVGAVLGLLVYAAGGSLLANLFLGSITEGALGGTGFGLSLGELVYGLALALLFGLVGSLYPVYRAIKMRPSEAIRHL